MQELFWFFLGGLFYLIVNKFISFYHKVKFISDIKIHSFKLIGFALEQLMFAMAAKYHYDKALEIDDWSDLMDILDKHYKKALDVTTQEHTEDA